MRGKVLFCMIVLCLLVAVPVSADTLIVEEITNAQLGATTNSGTNCEGSVSDCRFYTVRDAATAFTIAVNTTNPYNQLYNRSSLGYFYIYRTGFVYDASEIGTGTVNSARVTILGNAESASLGDLEYSFSDWSPTDPLSPVVADYNNTEHTLISTTNLTTGTFSLSKGMNNWTLAPSSINKEGYTTIYWRTTADIDNTSSYITWNDGTGDVMSYLRGYASPSSADKTWLTIDYTPAAGGDPPVASFTSDNTTVCLNEYVQFNDTSTGTNIDTWFWLFGDSQDSHIQNPVHYWDTPGSYTINLTVTDDIGENTTSKVDYITAVDCDPVANFTANDTTICLGESILFMDNSTLYPAPSIFDYIEWTFGDGNTTMGFRDDGYGEYEYTYGGVGTYDVSMEITTKYGSDLLSRKAYITVTDCIGNPDFSANATCQIGTPMTVFFTGYCPYPEFKNHWDFGTGDTSDDVQSVEYTYTEYGVYNVSHSCYNAPNPIIFENKTDYITVGFNGTVCAADCGTGCSEVTVYMERVPEDLPLNPMVAIVGIAIVILIVKKKHS